MPFNTNDLYDAHLENVQVATPMFRDFGGKKTFFGQIHTIKAYEDNTCIKAAFEESGTGKVLIVDAGGSLRCAMMGDQVAALGASNSWEGIIIYGCIRDSKAVSQVPLGVKALATIPRKTIKHQQGVRNVPVHFADVNFHPNNYVYADEDGFIVAKTALI
jgi:regulator of ribonuclease activity A